MKQGQERAQTADTHPCHKRVLQQGISQLAALSAEENAKESQR